MKSTALYAITLFVLSGCTDSGSPADSAPQVSLALAEGRLWADFRTPITPEDDNVRSEFRLLVRNASRTAPLQGLRIPLVEVFLSSGMQRIGAVELYTTWTGYVAPGTTDTVHLIKRTNQGPTLTPIPCDSLITFTIALKQGEDILGTARRDSVLFECYQ